VEGGGARARVRSTSASEERELMVLAQSVTARPGALGCWRCAAAAKSKSNPLEGGLLPSFVSTTVMIVVACACADMMMI